MAAERHAVVVLALGALSAACGGQPGVAPAVVESVGAPDHFGRGILRVDNGGERVLIQIGVPAFWAMVRFDAAGDVTAAAVSDVRRDPGMTWLVVPAGRQAASGNASVVANPACADNTARARRECGLQPRVVRAGTVPLRQGETIILFVSVEPLRAAVIEDRLNLVPAGAGVARVPAFVMHDQQSPWAAYVVRK